ncbi:hypothetical protein FRC02_004053, partial [Tulasnella sp. 418]
MDFNPAAASFAIHQQAAKTAASSPDWMQKFIFKGNPRSAIARNTPSNGTSSGVYLPRRPRKLRKQPPKAAQPGPATTEPVPSLPQVSNTPSSGETHSPTRKLSWTRVFKKSKHSNASKLSSSDSGDLFSKIPVVLKSLVKRSPKTTPIQVTVVSTPDDSETSSSSSSGSETQSSGPVSTSSSQTSAFSFVQVNIPHAALPLPTSPILHRSPPSQAITTAAPADRLVPRPPIRCRPDVSSSSRIAVRHYPRVSPGFATRPEQIWPTMTIAQMVEHKLMKRVRLLGEGGQGCVTLWKEAGTGQLVAVKSCAIPPGPQAALVKNFVDEQKVVKALIDNRGHWPSTIALFSSTYFVSTTSELLQIGEYINGSSILNIARVFTPNAMKSLLFQVAQGLKYIHSRGVIHRDIKGENLMINQHGVVKIIDFGLAVLTTANLDDLREFAGTPGFIAPEIERVDPCCTASDIWSLGICAIELLTGHVPVDSNDDAARSPPPGYPMSFYELLLFCFV